MPIAAFLQFWWLLVLTQVPCFFLIVIKGYRFWREGSDQTWQQSINIASRVILGDLEMFSCDATCVFVCGHLCTMLIDFTMLA